MAVEPNKTDNNSTDETPMTEKANTPSFPEPEDKGDFAVEVTTTPHTGAIPKTQTEKTYPFGNPPSWNDTPAKQNICNKICRDQELWRKLISHKKAPDMATLNKYAEIVQEKWDQGMIKKIAHIHDPEQDLTALPWWCHKLSQVPQCKYICRWPEGAARLHNAQGPLTDEELNREHQRARKHFDRQMAKAKPAIASNGTDTSTHKQQETFPALFTTPKKAMEADITPDSVPNILSQADLDVIFQIAQDTIDANTTPKTPQKAVTSASINTPPPNLEANNDAGMKEATEKSPVRRLSSSMENLAVTNTNETQAPETVTISDGETSTDDSVVVDEDASTENSSQMETGDEPTQSRNEDHNLAPNATNQERNMDNLNGDELLAIALSMTASPTLFQIRDGELIWANRLPTPPPKPMEHRRGIFVATPSGRSLQEHMTIMSHFLRSYHVAQETINRHLWAETLYYIRILIPKHWYSTIHEMLDTDMCICCGNTGHKGKDCTNHTSCEFCTPDPRARPHNTSMCPDLHALCWNCHGRGHKNPFTKDSGKRCKIDKLKNWTKNHEKWLRYKHCGMYTCAHTFPGSSDLKRTHQEAVEIFGTKLNQDVNNQLPKLAQMANSKTYNARGTHMGESGLFVTYGRSPSPAPTSSRRPTETSAQCENQVFKTPHAPRERHTAQATTRSAATALAQAHLPHLGEVTDESDSNTSVGRKRPSSSTEDESTVDKRLKQVEERAAYLEQQLIAARDDFTARQSAVATALRQTQEECTQVRNDLADTILELHRAKRQAKHASPAQDSNRHHGTHTHRSPRSHHSPNTHRGRTHRPRRHRESSSSADDRTPAPSERTGHTPSGHRAEHQVLETTHYGPTPPAGRTLAYGQRRRNPILDDSDSEDN